MAENHTCLFFVTFVNTRQRVSISCSPSYRLLSTVAVFLLSVAGATVYRWQKEAIPVITRSHMYMYQFNSVQSNLFNSSQTKSQWKASLKRWVLSPARNWLRLTDGDRRWSGSEFQTTGAPMKKLFIFRAYLFWFVERTDRHARPSGDQDDLNCQRLCRQCY